MNKECPGRPPARVRRRASAARPYSPLVAAALACAVLGCGPPSPSQAPTGRPSAGQASAGPAPGGQALSLDAAAERYVKLALAFGEHDSDYVDAYYGPPAWRDEARREKLSLGVILERTRALGEAVRSAPPPRGDEALALRHVYLARQLESMAARAEMLQGKKLSFDDESRALYDAVAPRRPESYFRQLAADLDRELPGRGPLADRLEAFRAGFVIPKERLDAVIKAAVEGCRARTLPHVKLPAGESFAIEYVTNKPWGGYNWYQGNFRSVIQVNTDLPIFIDRAVDLACHEGYPGHHVYNVILEERLVRGRGWVEFQLSPLYGPLSLIAEGSANYGIEVAFPGGERVEFERAKLFPLAGLDPARAERYHRVRELTTKLGYAADEAARDYVDGTITADQAVDRLSTYALMSPPRARQRLKFFEQYRSYTINYSLGTDLVKQYIESLAGGDRERRWQGFVRLLSAPRLPSTLH
jgi:hypothetical protein